MGWSSIAYVILVPLAVGYLLVAACVTLLQRKLIYKPDQRRTTPEEAGHHNVETWNIDTADGEQIVAWYVPARHGLPTILYFHGNRGWIELRSERLCELADRGYGVLMPSLRSYGGSTGKPSEAANVADAIAAYDALVADGVDPGRIIAFGESLGSGIATQLAAHRTIEGLVLDSPYSSMSDLAQLRYPWLPVRYLLLDRYETRRHIRAVRAPILILHGEADDLVPCEMGQAVCEAAPYPKLILTYPDATHLDHIPMGSFNDLDRWIATLTAQDSADSVMQRPKQKARS